MAADNEFDIVLKLIDQLTPAMAQVQSQLKTAMASMAGSTKPVSDAMERLSKSLSGDKIIQDAKNITAAITQIGGATKLTEAEAAKYNATLTEAIAKLKVMGKEAPADMQALAAATKKADTALQGVVGNIDVRQAITNPLGTATQAMGTFAASMGPVVAGAAAVGAAVFALAAKAASMGAALDDMSDKTGVSVPALSKLSNAADVAGADMGQLTDVIFKLERGIGENTDAFQAGLKQIGLSTAELKAAGPDHYLELVAAGLAGLDDPSARAAAGTAVLGRGFKDVAAALADLDAGFKLTADIHPWTADQAKEAERFEQQMKSLVIHAEALATALGRDMIGPIASFVSGMTDASKALANLFGGFGGVLTPIYAVREAFDLATAAVNTFRDASHMLPSVPAAPTLPTRAFVVPLIDEHVAIGHLEEDYRKLEAARKKSAAAADAWAAVLAEVDSAGADFRETILGIDGAIVPWAQHLLQSGVDAQIVAKYYGLTSTQIKALQEDLKQHTEALKIAEAITKTFTAEGHKHFKEWFDSLAKNLDAANKKVVTTFEGFLKAQRDYHEAVARDTLSADDFQRFQLQQQLDDAKRQLAALGASYQATYDLIAETVRIKLSEIGTLWKESEHQMIPPNLAGSVTQVTSAVQQLQTAFAQLGQTIGGTFGAIFVGAATMAGALGNVYKAQQAFNANQNEQNRRALAVSKQQAAAAAIGVGASLVAQTINTGAGAPTRNLVAAGALQGAATGAVIGAPYAAGTFGISVGAGAAAGAIVGWIQSGKEWRKVVNDIGRDLGGLRVSEDFAKFIKELEDQTGLQRVQALTTQLDKLMEQAGGLNAMNFNLFFGKLHDAFSFIEQGGLSVAQVTQIVDKNFAEMARVGTDSLGQINDQIRELIDLDQRFGTHSQAIVEWMKGQAAAMATGLSDLLSQPALAGLAAVGQAVADAQKALDDLKAAGTATGQQLTDATDAVTRALTAQHQEAERSKHALDDLGQIALTTFNAAIASGQTFAQALAAISPQLDMIKKAYDDLGLAIDDAALKGLTLENTILNGAAGMGKVIAGLQAIVTAAMNLGTGVETPEALAAQQRTLGQIYTQTQAATAAAGGTTINALLPFQQTLHQMDEWAKKNHLELDANTRQMIDQSKELGIWNADFKTDSEKTRDSIADLIKSNEALATALGDAAGRLAAAAPPTFASEAYVRRPTMALVGDVPGGEFVVRPSTIANWMGAAFVQGTGASAAGPISSSTVVNKSYTVTIVARNDDAAEQWRDWMRRDGVEIAVEEIEDGRYVSRMNRALTR